MTNRAKLPGLPRVATQDQALNRWITAVAERLEVREGSRGDPGERAVTVKELQTLTRNAVKVVGGELVASGALAGGTDPTADPNFVARLEEAIRNTRLYQNLVKRLDDPSRFDDLATEVRQALANSIAQEALARGADIRRVETKIQQSDRSLAMAVEELTAAIGTSAAGIREVKSAFATADRAQAAKVTQLEARLDVPIADADKLPLPPAAPYASLAALKAAVPKGVTGKYYRVAGATAGAPELLYAWNGKEYLLAGEGTNAKLEEVMKVTADRVTGAESEYTMKVEATTGGVTAVAGFGLSAAVDPAGQKTSAFIVRADKFAVVAPGDTSDTDRYPFGVDASGVYINGALRVNSGGKTAEELANDFYLTATGQVFTQNPNTSTLTPSSVTLTAVRKGTIASAGTLTFSTTPAGLANAVAGNLNQVTIPSAAFATNNSIKVTATLTHNNVTYTDDFTLYKVTDGADALVGFLTNESHALAASADGTVSSYTGASGDFVVFKGGAKLTSTTTPSVTYSVATNTSNLTATISATGAYSVTGGLTSDLATVTFRATVGSQTIDKVFTLARVKAGAAPDYVDYVFIRNASAPTTPTATTGIPAGWSDTPPAGTDPLYMSKATKKADDTVVGSWSTPARLDGMPGADGKYTEVEYAVGSSATTAPTSEWQATPPAISSGQFLWMRSRVVTPPAAAPAWGAAVRISGEKGDQGQRGAAFATSTAASPSDSAFTAASGLSPVLTGDQLMLTNSSGSTIYTRQSWGWANTTALQVHGDAVITGTLAASKLAAGTVTAEVNFDTPGYFDGSGTGKAGKAKVNNTGSSNSDVLYSGRFNSTGTATTQVINGTDVKVGYVGVIGTISGTDGAGVYGESPSASTAAAGVVGCGYYGVVGKAMNGTSGSVGVYARAEVSGSTALYVDGPSTFSGDLSSTADIKTTGNITAYSSSDRRLKTNITPLQDALQRVSLLRGVTYDWTDDYINACGGEDGYFVRRKDVGVIAQEVQEVLPEIVAERRDGSLAVRYDRLVPLLIEAIKELQARVEVLEAK